MDDIAFLNDGCDLNAFVRLRWMGKRLRTKTFDRKASAKDKKVEFNQLIKFGVPWPTSLDRITLHVMDDDNLKEDMIGSIYLSAADIVKNYSEKVVNGKTV